MNTIPSDSPSIYEALRTLVASGQTLALLSPATPPDGIAGFLFDIDLDQSAALQSEITDHFVEDNTAVQDHIALRPETVTLSGFVAEIVSYRKTAKSTPTVQPTLPLPPGVEAVVDPGEEQVRAAAAAQSEQFTQRATAAASNSLYGYYEGRLPQQPNQSRQSMVFGYFYQLWKGRMLFSVDTPFGLMQDMAIESVNARQGAESKWASEFSITLKRIRKADTISKSKGLLAGRSTFQRAAVANNGSLGMTLAAESMFNSLLTQTPANLSPSPTGFVP